MKYVFKQKITLTNNSFQTYSNLIGHSDLIQTLYSYDINDDEDENILVSGSCDTTIKLWNTTTKKLINTSTG